MFGFFKRRRLAKEAAEASRQRMRERVALTAHKEMVFARHSGSPSNSSSSSGGHSPLHDPLSPLNPLSPFNTVTFAEPSTPSRHVSEPVSSHCSSSSSDDSWSRSSSSSGSDYSCSSSSSSSDSGSSSSSSDSSY